MFALTRQKNDTHIYLVMEYCSGNDLSIYLRNRGHIDTLDFMPRVYESAMVASRDGKVFWPHPPSGGLDERVTRCFLGQLGGSWSYHAANHDQPKQYSSFARRI